MLDLDPIKARLAASSSLRRGYAWTGGRHGLVFARKPDEPAETIARGIEFRGDTDLIANAPDDLTALVAEVERLRRLVKESENLRSEAARMHQQEREHAKQERYEFAEERIRLTGKYWKLASAIERHRDGWRRSENLMLTDRVIKRAAMARELWEAIE